MRLRLILSLLAFIGLASLIGWMGPIVSIGDIKPLETIWSRGVLMALAGGLILGPLCWRMWIAAKTEKALKLGLTKQEEDAHIESVKLRQIFNEAVSTLKKHQTPVRWYEGKAGLYELPWYVFIGPPGSGKTTALQNAGLRFPLQGQNEQAFIRGVGGTRNCDWWFSDQAVLIDTAGRFTTQDANAGSDAAGWHAFLGLLKQHRPRQPLNGVLLTLSVQALMEHEDQRTSTAKTIGLRLQEMIQALGMCPPVYVLITKTDMLKGFAETFGRLSEEERAQGWGINFEHPNPLPTTLTKTLPDKLAGLNEHLILQLNKRFEQEPQESRRVEIYEFTQAFAQLKPALENMLRTALESDSLFEKPVQLRGVYFTSGTQDGTVFDRILSRFQRVSAANPHNTQAAFSGKGYFIRRVLTEVIFPEQHLASQVRKKAMLAKLGYHGTLGLASVLSLLLLFGWWVSHGNNSKTLSVVNQKADAIAIQITDVPRRVELQLPPLLATLDSMVDLSPTPLTGFWHHLGLNQHDKIEQARLIAYENALKNNLIPILAKRLEEGLRDTLVQTPDDSYDALKAYLMLHDMQHLDKAALKAWVKADWQRHVLPSLEPVSVEAALKHLDKAIESAGSPESLPALNTELVEQVRRIVQAQSPESRLYQKLLQTHDRARHDAFDLAQVLGTNHLRLFTRKSGKSLSEGVDSFFTRQVYLLNTLPAMSVEAQRLQSEMLWVLGLPKDSNTMATQELLMRTRQRYVQEYITAWDHYIADIRLSPTTNFEAALESTRALASSQSPLRKLLEAVSKNTSLVSGLADPAKQLGSKAQGAIPTWMLTPPEQQVDEHFSELNLLLSGNPPAYSKVHALLSDLHVQLSAIAMAKKNQSAPPAPSQLDSIQTQAALMPEPVRSVVEQLGQHGRSQGQVAERASLSAELKPLQEFCARTAANRYPMHMDAGTDMLVEDFTRLFGHRGLMEQFFNTRLAGLVNMGSKPWQFKQGTQSGRGTNPAALVQFQRAQRIREVYFPGDQSSPAFEFDMRLVSASHPTDTFYLDNNGTLMMFSLQYDPQHTVRWKSPTPATMLKVRSSQGAERTFKGPWALFRLFDTATIQASERSDLFRATFTLDGKRFEFELQANSAFNPLRLPELRQFRCPGDL